MATKNVHSVCLKTVRSQIRQHTAISKVLGGLEAIYLSRVVENFHQAAREMKTAFDAVDWADKTACRAVGYRGPGITKISLGGFSPKSKLLNWVEIRKGGYSLSKITKREARRRSKNPKRGERIILFGAVTRAKKK
jgi:hypothetical protein